MNSTGSGVTVTCLCPGATATEFHKRANATGMRLLKFGSMDARTVAEDGYRALMAWKARGDFRIQELAGGAIGALLPTAAGDGDCQEDAGRVDDDERRASARETKQSGYFLTESVLRRGFRH